MEFLYNVDKFSLSCEFVRSRFHVNEFSDVADIVLYYAIKNEHFEFADWIMEHTGAGIGTITDGEANTLSNLIGVSDTVSEYIINVLD